MNTIRKKITEALTADLIDLLNNIATTKAIKKGDFLFQEGMPAKELYLIRTGLVQISKLTHDGKELTLRMSSKNDIVGELTLFTSNAHYMLSAKVVNDGEVAVIDKAIFEKELEKNGQLAFEFMKWFSTHLQKTQTKFRDLMLNGRKGALYSTLIRMTNSYGVHLDNGILIDIALTNQELANFCGTSRESINRMLSDMRKNDVISMEDGKIIIHDVDWMKEEINCEGCPVEWCSID